MLLDLAIMLCIAVQSPAPANTVPAGPVEAPPASQPAPDANPESGSNHAIAASLGVVLGLVLDVVVVMGLASLQTALGFTGGGPVFIGVAVAIFPIGIFLTTTAAMMWAGTFESELRLASNAIRSAVVGGAVGLATSLIIPLLTLGGLYGLAALHPDDPLGYSFLGCLGGCAAGSLISIALAAVAGYTVGNFGWMVDDVELSEPSVR